MKNADKFIKNWEKTRKKGKLKYVINYSIFLTILITTVNIIVRLYLVGLSIFKTEFHLYILTGIVVIGFIGGPLVSIIYWNESEEKYNKLKNVNDNVKK